MLRIGLVGAGKFGGYHAGKLAAHSAVEFTGIFDTNLEASATLSESHGVNNFSQFGELLQACDALIIATPATYHGDYALKGIEAGKHLLIEKPMAVEVSDARRITELAEKQGLKVQIGHQERFVARAIGLDKIPEKPLLIKAQRLNPYSPRGTDTSVTLDLMIHDIDLVLWLMGTTVKSVSGHTRKVKSLSSDQSWAQLEFNNATAFLETSRLAQKSIRELEITYPSGTVTIDFNAKTLTHNTPFQFKKSFRDNPNAQDSLAAGLNEFVSAILKNRAPFISAQDGLAAVEVAALIDRL